MLAAARFRPLRFKSLLPTSRRHDDAILSKETTLITATTSSLLLLVAAATLHASYASLDDSASDTTKPLDYQMEVDFMAKLARKPYLQGAAAATSSRSSSPLDKDEHANTSLLHDTTLRIVAVDVDLSGGFCRGTCRTALDKVYPHGIAPDKQVVVLSKGDLQNTRASPAQQKSYLSVEQKVWVTSLLECRAGSSSNNNRSSRPGIQVLQADTRALNPHGLGQRPVTITSSASMRSRLGGFASKELAQRKQQKTTATTGSTAGESAAAFETASAQAATSDTPLSATQRELDAPWNQHAWMEELELRLSGQIPFDATLQPASWWSRRLFGRAYQAIYPAAAAASSSSFESNVILRWLSRNAATTTAADLNKPHAVIANGAALQAMPKALRLLQKTCQEQDIPLFIIHDPRAWRNTHNDLNQVLRDVRRIVKERIIAKSLQESRNSTARAFERGRMLGRLETDAKHTAKEFFLRRKRSEEQARQQQREETMDWKRLSADELMDKLQQHGVIREKQQGVFTYTDSFLSLARQSLGVDKVKADGNAATVVVVSAGAGDPNV